MSYDVMGAVAQLGAMSEADSKLWLDGLHRMLRIRKFEESAMDLIRKGVGIAGSVHVCIGQEAAIVGACLAMRDDDFMVGYHRSHGHPIAKGAELAPLMAELMGKATGICRGKGGSMHLADFKVGSLGETAIIGAGIPQAAGAAYGARIRGTDQIALAFFGDGGANIGTFHEGLNLAAKWNLGAIFVCENNLYAMSTSLEDTLAGDGIASRASAYGMPGVEVDGQDVMAMHAVTAEAVRRAREGEGPTLIEARTYRWRDHAEYGGPALGGRPEAEVDSWRSRDPISILVDRLLAAGCERSVIDAIDATVATEIAEAVAFARSSPQPGPDELFEDLFATPIGGD